MTQQNINVGTNPNDGTGDPIRTAMIKVQNNFSDLYTNYVSNAQLTANLANYLTSSGLAANVLTLTVNNTNFVGSVAAANVVSNSQLQANLFNFVNTAQLSTNLANYQTTAGLSANVATLNANNATYLNGVAAASYVNTTGNFSLSGNLTFTNNLIVASNAAVYANGSLGSNGQILTSNGSSVYWGVSVGVNTFSQYTWANTQTFTANIVANNVLVGSNTVVNTSVVFVGNSSQNAYITSSGLYVNGAAFVSGGGYYKGNQGIVGNPSNANNLFRINANTMSNNITIAPGENALTVGPINIGTGNTLTISTGGRVVII